MVSRKPRRRQGRGVDRAAIRRMAERRFGAARMVDDYRSVPAPHRGPMSHASHRFADNPILTPRMVAFEAGFRGRGRVQPGVVRISDDAAALRVAEAPRDVPADDRRAHLRPRHSAHRGPQWKKDTPVSV
jgi:hypothetical protein